MESRILIILILLTAFCVVPVAAQETDKKNNKEKPNLSGTWILDESKSRDLMKELFKKSEKPESPDRKVVQKLTIEHREPEIKLVETQTVEVFDGSGKLIGREEKNLLNLIFYTDKRGEKNVFDQNQSFESRTAWKGKEIFSAVTVDSKKNIISSIKFALSKNGDELTITALSFQSQNSSSGGYVTPVPPAGKKVYRKVIE